MNFSHLKSAYNKLCAKPRKVRRRPAVDLSTDTLHDILAFFNRKSLIRLCSVDSRFNQTIQRGFANTPYLLRERLYIILLYITTPYLLGKLRFIGHSEDEYTRFPNGEYIPNRKFVEYLLAAKFVRYPHAEITCSDLIRPTHILAMNHLWQSCDLSFKNGFKLTKFHARRLAKCKKFNSIAFFGSVTFLPELFLGNCLQLHISDDLFTTADSASVPWTKMIDFLFREGGTEDKPRSISINTKYPPNHREYFQFVNSVEQRFAAASTRLHFEFEWNPKFTSLGEEVYDTTNTHTNQRLIHYHDGFAVCPYMSLHTES
ncbi:hypothetical protein DdX_15503 [Ditylenchus destructor]|uniref:F-box domain-containing protein n=1 Tax=Ditylenchus destructor TaxID=166010 RepID=A0AAD4MV85_9BILA|nr:hypothetical protein DdX_15503 [Ditylenchus destructor]